MSSHAQTWVKVNAQVDEGIAEIVAILSRVDGLQTIESCQGEPAANPQAVEVMAYVYFDLGDWRALSKFAFETIAAAIEGIEDASVAVKIDSGCEPRGRLGAPTSSLANLSLALSAAVSLHNSGCPRGKEHTALRS